MSLATEGDYGDDLGHGYIRRPISVAQLLEREGYRPAARSRATRRALTGVAAGAVLALGAVVGSLLLNHAGNNTAGDTLASGSGGNEIVLGNHQPAVSTYPRNVAQQQASTSVSVSTTTPQSVSTPSTNHAQTRPQTPAGTQPVAANPVVPQSSTRSATTTTATSTTQSAPTTGTTGTTTTSPTTGTTSTTPPAQSAPAPTSPAPSTGSGGSNNGGLLGTVTGTLTGTLNSVTQPVFNWFG